MTKKNEDTGEEVVLDWADLFGEIGYAYERQYPPHIHYSDGKKYVTFHKLTICDEGWIEYKGQYTNFNKADYWKVEMIAKLFEVGAGDVLFGNKT